MMNAKLLIFLVLGLLLFGCCSMFAPPQPTKAIIVPGAAAEALNSALAPACSDSIQVSLGNGSATFQMTANASRPVNCTSYVTNRYLVYFYSKPAGPLTNYGIAVQYWGPSQAAPRPSTLTLALNGNTSIQPTTAGQYSFYFLNRTVASPVGMVNYSVVMLWP